MISFVCGRGVVTSFNPRLNFLRRVGGVLCSNVAEDVLISGMTDRKIITDIQKEQMGSATKKTNMLS